MKKDLRTGPRYFLNPPIPGTVNGNPVRVVDLGARGGRVELRESIEPGTAIDLTIGSIRVRATVLWCQVDTLNFACDYDGYLAGVAFETPNGEVEHLAVDLCNREFAVRIEELRAHDRYRITAPLTGSFGDFAPVSIVDLSVAGARMAMLHRPAVGHKETLRFQVDDESGPIGVTGTIMWCRPSPIIREHYAGLEIEGAEEQLRGAIHRLCTRNEARIDIDSLKRKFDMLRLASRLGEKSQKIAV